MRQFFKNNPYIIIYIIVSIFASLLFGWGKIFRGLEWYLDKGNMIIAILISILGIVLCSTLWYFRYHTEDPAEKK